MALIKRSIHVPRSSGDILQCRQQKSPFVYVLPMLEPLKMRYRQSSEKFRVSRKLWTVDRSEPTPSRDSILWSERVRSRSPCCSLSNTFTATKNISVSRIEQLLMICCHDSYVTLVSSYLRDWISLSNDVSCLTSYRWFQVLPIVAREVLTSCAGNQFKGLAKSCVNNFLFTWFAQICTARYWREPSRPAA